MSAIRLDKWLWFARIVKTRAIAQTIIERGQVSINGATARKAGVDVAPGDTVAIVLGPIRRTVIMRQPGARRGPSAEAQGLYDEPGPPEHLSWEDAAVPVHRRVRPSEKPK